MFESLETGNCRFNFDIDEVCRGDDILGTITDGKNVSCIVGMNFNFLKWEVIETIRTNENGKYSKSTTIDNAGEYIFAAVCDNEGNFCRTNNQFLTVRECGP